MQRAIDIFVGNRIRERRIELGVTQASLAGAVRVGTEQLNDYETGITQINPNTLAWIAMALDCPLGWLFGLPGKSIAGLGFTTAPQDDNSAGRPLQQ